MFAISEKTEALFNEEMMIAYIFFNGKRDNSFKKKFKTDKMLIQFQRNKKFYLH